MPKNFLEAVNGPNSAHWKKTIDEELEAHRRNETWSIIPRDPGVSTIDSKWVFKEVRGEDGEIERFKAMSAPEVSNNERVWITPDFCTSREVRLTPCTVGVRGARRFGDEVVRCPHCLPLRSAE